MEGKQQQKLLSPYYRRLRSAMALNNIGVSQLEKQCYAQAVNSLEHAFQLLSSSDGETSSSFNDIGGEELVNQSLQHLSNPRASKRAVLLLEVLTMTSDGSILQCDDSSALEVVLEEAPCSHLAFPVRIEDVHYSERQMAAVHHNLGIACYCLGSTLRRNKSHAQQFKESALRLAQESSKILFTLLSELQQNKSFHRRQPCDDVIELHCLAVAVLNSTFLWQQECSNSSRMSAEDTYGLLVHLRSQALELQCQQDESAFFSQRSRQNDTPAGGTAAAA